MRPSRSAMFSATLSGAWFRRTDDGLQASYRLLMHRLDVLVAQSHKPDHAEMWDDPVTDTRLVLDVGCRFESGHR